MYLDFVASYLSVFHCFNVGPLSLAVYLCSMGTLPFFLLFDLIPHWYRANQLMNYYSEAISLAFHLLVSETLDHHCIHLHHRSIPGCSLALESFVVGQLCSDITTASLLSILEECSLKSIGSLQSASSSFGLYFAISPLSFQFLADILKID